MHEFSSNRRCVSFASLSNGDPLENLRINFMAMGDEKAIPADRKAVTASDRGIFYEFRSLRFS